MDQSDELKSFDRQIEAAGKRFESLLQKFDASSERLPATADVIEELGTALEELHSASDEMSAQIDELAASRSALEEQQRKYMDLFEFAPDAYLVTDAQGFIQEANRAAGGLLHAPHDYLLDKPLANYLHAADHLSFRTKLSQLAQGQISEWRDWKIHLKPQEGELTPVSVDVAVMEDEAGKRADLRWMLRDVTQRERREALLQDSEALLERMFSTVDLSIAYMDKDFNYLRVNRAFADIDGRQPDFYVGKNHFDLSPDASQQAIFKQVVSSGQAYTFNERLITDAGRSRQGVTYWNWSLQPVKDAMGETQALVYSLADVTIRKEAEIALKAEHEQRLFAEGLAKATLALNSSLDLSEVLDMILEQIQVVIPFRAANVVLLEGETARISRHRGVGESFQIPPFLHQELSLDFFPIWRTIYDSCQPLCVPDTQAEPRWNHALGFDWPRSYLGVPLCIGAGVVGFLNLLSEQVDFFNLETIDRLTAFASQAALAIQNARLYKDLEHALEQEHAMRSRLVQAEKFAGMGRMLASVAHELNNPLQTIKNCLYLTAQEAAPDAPMQEYMQMALEETNRLANIVGQLRELYRPLPSSTSHPHALSKILDEVHALLESQLQEKRVDWRQEAAGEDLPVNCYPEQIKQVFINIGRNAIEAMEPAGGTLSVRLYKSEDASQALVAFQDTGPGMPPDVLNTLFEPFFTTKINGTGLGLSISYELVERHHGHISVESQVGQGTTFTVWLPLVR